MNMVNNWFHIGTSAALRMFHKHPTMEPLACNLWMLQNQVCHQNCNLSLTLLRLFHN
jgi:hypothetical protein